MLLGKSRPAGGGCGGRWLVGQGDTNLGDSYPRPRPRARKAPSPGQSDNLACQGTVSTSGPSSVMAMVCSKWADRRPSAVTTLQPSPSSRVPAPPALTMGSTAKTLPALSLGPGLPGQ